MGMLLPTMPRLDDATRATLTKITRRPTSQQRHADRARWVLALDGADGDVRAVAAGFGISPTTVRKWARRVGDHGPTAWSTPPAAAAPASTTTPPSATCSSWPPRSTQTPTPCGTHAELARRMGDLNWGVTPSWVSRTLSRLHLKVHQVRGWLHRRPDPHFTTKVAAVQSIINGAADDAYRC